MNVLNPWDQPLITALPMLITDLLITHPNSGSQRG